MQQEVQAEFDSKWEAGEITGWEESNTKVQAATNGTSAGIWCSACKCLLFKQQQS
jgi:splicing factor 3A subunit 3